MNFFNFLLQGRTISKSAVQYTIHELICRSRRDCRRKKWVKIEWNEIRISRVEEIFFPGFFIITHKRVFESVDDFITQVSDELTRWRERLNTVRKSGCVLYNQR